MTQNGKLTIAVLLFYGIIIWYAWLLGDLQGRLTKLETVHKSLDTSQVPSAITSCVFDNATKVGDYVTLSATVAGDCHDLGDAETTTYMFGEVLQTGSAGAHLISVWDIKR